MRDSYPLRPELVESMMYHDIVFGNGEMVHWGKMILEQLRNTMTKVGQGHAWQVVRLRLGPQHAERRAGAGNAVLRIVGDLQIPVSSVR